MSLQDPLDARLSSLTNRIRHTDLLVIAGWSSLNIPSVETIDLTNEIKPPTILQLLEKIRASCDISKIFMMQEFQTSNTSEIQQQFIRSMKGIPVIFEPFELFKNKASHGTGLIRVKDEIPNADLILLFGFPPSFYADMLSLF